MIQQRPINLNPDSDRLEVVKITYPRGDSRRPWWTMQPMRFIPHDGRASCSFRSRFVASECVNNRGSDER